MKSGTCILLVLVIIGMSLSCGQGLNQKAHLLGFDDGALLGSLLGCCEGPNVHVGDFDGNIVGHNVGQNVPYVGPKWS